MKNNKIKEIEVFVSRGKFKFINKIGDDDKSQINEEFNDEWNCIAFQPVKIIYEEKKYLSDGLKQNFEFKLWDWQMVIRQSIEDGAFK